MMGIILFGVRIIEDYSSLWRLRFVWGSYIDIFLCQGICLGWIYLGLSKGHIVVVVVVVACVASVLLDMHTKTKT